MSPHVREDELPTILLLEVTADDIRTAERGDPNSCALAKALKRQTGSDRVAVTDFDDIEVWFIDEDGERATARYRGPKAITKYLDRFDGFGDGTGRFRADVKPRTFPLKRVAG